MATPVDQSFILELDFRPECRIHYASESVPDLLGYNPEAITGISFFDLVHPSEVNDTREHLMKTIFNDKVAVIAYLRLRHSTNVWILCALLEAVVHDRLVVSVSLVGPPTRIMFRNNTATEVAVLTHAPEAHGLAYRRWNDPTPAQSQDNSRDPAPRQALRLGRFSDRSTIDHCTNEFLLSRHAIGRSFLDFVAPDDYLALEECIMAMKHWGAHETGRLSDGGFIHLQFHLMPQSRRGNVPAHVSGTVFVDAYFWATSDAVLCILRSLR